MPEPSEATPEKKPRHRSPNYPYIGLREAVERVGKFYGKDGKAGAPPDLAAVHIGFSSAHGQAMISTAIALTKPYAIRGSGPQRLQTIKVITAIPTTAGTK